ncbi:unnamed protein product [Clavelina lepadiformis]|uniref:Dual adapter for phosphotyrosine and 3-phosphotyrosine and 3-phosphoinositide n=1 Tax=Clavelina lepadiformis TaxID=159417 RepID=A0ABP0GFP6_CLALP
MDSLDWYHGNMSRHIAEALLMANGREGSFLLRDVPGTQCVSVRGQDAVKHFKMERKGSKITFAHSEFDSVSQLLQVFANQVILCSQTGSLSKNFEQGTFLILKHPYPKQVEEPDSYDETMMLHSTFRDNATLEDLKRQTKAVALASKSGYLTKQGGNVKNWKLRWFVLLRNEFSYFESRSSVKPIRTINLEECEKMETCELPGKSNCFKLSFPERTWYFSANSEEDLGDWVSIIQWKLNQNQSQEQKSNKFIF